MNKDNKHVEVPGIVYVPYIMKTCSTSVNGITVWHSNKFINFLIKIKHFFYTPKALRKFNKYANKPVNSKFYSKIQIN